MWNRNKCGSAFSFSNGVRRTASPNGYRWDEDANFAKNVLQAAKDAAKVNKDENSDFCAIWDIEGQGDPGQPEWAYVGYPRFAPASMPVGLIRDIAYAFWEQGVRPMFCIRHTEVVTVPTGVFRRNYASESLIYERLCEVIDYVAALGGTGAYFDSNGRTGNLLWKQSPRTPLAGNGAFYVPPLVPATVILKAIKYLNLQFDVFGEFGDESYDQAGVAYWHDPRGGDVTRWGMNAGGIKRIQYPNAMRIIPGIDSEILKTSREAEFIAAIREGNILVINGGVPSARPEWGATWRVQELYRKAIGTWPVSKPQALSSKKAVKKVDMGGNFGKAYTPRLAVPEYQQDSPSSVGSSGEYMAKRDPNSED